MGDKYHGPAEAPVAPAQGNPPLNLPPNAAEVDARMDRERLTDLERHGGTCPTCGQQIPALTNRFATGPHGVLPKAEAVDQDSPLDPDGELAYNVFERLREGQPIPDICAALDVTKAHARGVADHYRARLTGSAA